MQLLYEELKKPAKQSKIESPHKIKFNWIKTIITKTVHLVKKKIDIITRFGEWTELIIKNIKNLTKINQIKKSNINKFWKNNLINFKGVIHLNNTARIIKKKLLKNKDCENMNILKK